MYPSRRSPPPAAFPMPPAGAPPRAHGLRKPCTDRRNSSIFSILRTQIGLTISEECIVNSLVIFSIDALGSPPSAKSPRRRCTAFGSSVMSEVMAASTRPAPPRCRGNGVRAQPPGQRCCLPYSPKLPSSSCRRASRTSRPNLLIVAAQRPWLPSLSRVPVPADMYESSAFLALPDVFWSSGSRAELSFGMCSRLLPSQWCWGTPSAENPGPRPQPLAYWVPGPSSWD